MKALAGSAILALLLSACGRPLQVDYYDFDFQKPIGVDQLIFRSSTIIVGMVRSVVLVRQGVPARKMPELLLDQMHAVINVENVILGQLQHPDLRLEYFTYSWKNKGGYSGPPPLRLEPGDRRIFFMTMDSGQFRSVADVRDEYAISVWTGVHRNCCDVVNPDDPSRLAGPGAIGNSIATILLERGENYQRDGIINTLSHQSYIASRLAGRATSAALLKRLAADPREPEIAAKACLILSEQYYGQYGCLAKLETNSTVPAKLKEQLATMKLARGEMNKRLKQSLMTNPLLAFQHSAFPDSVIGVRTELFMLLDDPDPELHSLACAVLRSYYHEAPDVCAKLGTR